MGNVGFIMGDTSALEKQLNLKTKKIQELQELLTQKTNYLFDQDDDMQNKERSHYYTERLLDTKSREKKELDAEASRLDMRVNPDFAKAVDAGETKVEETQAAIDALEGDVEACKVATKALKAEADVYARVMKKFDNGLIAGNKIADEVRKQSADLQASAGKNRDEIDELKKDIERTGENSENTKRDINFLEQWRTDSIFRQFTLKAKIRLIQLRLSELDKE